MGHTQARDFLTTLLRAITTNDYESVEQLRRLLAVERYRKLINSGHTLDETRAVPSTADVQKWLSQLDTDSGVLSEIKAMLKRLE